MEEEVLVGTIPVDEIPILRGNWCSPDRRIVDGEGLHRRPLFDDPAEEKSLKRSNFCSIASTALRKEDDRYADGDPLDHRAGARDGRSKACAIDEDRPGKTCEDPEDRPVCDVVTADEDTADGGTGGENVEPGDVIADEEEGVGIDGADDLNPNPAASSDRSTEERSQPDDHPIP